MRMVPNSGEGGRVELWLILVEVLFFFNWYTFFVCLTRPILLPEIFESGKK